MNTVTNDFAVNPNETNALSVDGQRLWATLMELGKIGETPKGGSCRLALTELDGRGRDAVMGWMKDAGLTVSVDSIGNIFGCRPGIRNDLAPVATGSHIDTQPTGGKFDGCYGVIAGLEVMRTLNDLNVQTLRPLELVVWTNEEGSRFSPGMMGSAVYAGDLSLHDARASQDVDGVSVAEALQRIGYDGNDVRRSDLFASYIETHIEQGPILEDEDQEIGVVTGSLGLRWYDITIVGLEAHAGPTPMSARRDALYAATHVIQAAIDTAVDHGGRGTVGQLDVFPKSRNVIPGKVTFSLDLRHEDEAVLTTMTEQVSGLCASIGAGSLGKPFDVTIDEVLIMPPNKFAGHIVDQVESHALARGYSHRRMVTGAGHDAVQLSHSLPVGMVFVPCKDGISHNEAEYARPEHLEAGANVLLDVMLAEAAKA